MTDAAQINSLYDPFQESELRGDDTNLSKEDNPVQTFSNKGIPLVSVLLVITAVMICLTIYMGFFYELGFRKAKISKTADLIAAGDTAEEADTIRAAETAELTSKMTGDLEVAGYAVGALAVVAALIFFGMFWYWKGVAQPELTRENIIGRDLASAMQTGKSLDNVANLLAYHVHPNDQASKDDLKDNLKANLTNAMDKEIMFTSRVARRLRGAPPALG